MLTVFFILVLLDICSAQQFLRSYCSTGSCNSPNVFQSYCCLIENTGKNFRFSDSKGTRTIIFCPTYIPIECNATCGDVLLKNPSARSGHYNLSSGVFYCDMEGVNCDGRGGWTRVAYLNMTEPGASCPPELTVQNHSNINHEVCGRSASYTGGCQSAIFSTYGLNYSKVCGQIRGYQYRSPDAFHSYQGNGGDIDSFYVDGVSLTHGSNPRKHIWTYVGGLMSDNSIYALSTKCPCNYNLSLMIPTFVSNDYYCESGLHNEYWEYMLYTDDPLWDGKQCLGPEAGCCLDSKMPWFLKTLETSTNDSIELRLCSNQGYPDEDTPLDIIELFIK